MISGFIHTMMDHGFGIPVRESGSVGFFLLQVFGMLVEDYGRGICSSKLMPKNRLFKLVVGYVWTFGFLVWSARSWTNSMVCQLYEAGQPLPTPFLIPGSDRFLVQGVGG